VESFLHLVDNYWQFGIVRGEHSDEGRQHVFHVVQLLGPFAFPPIEPDGIIAEITTHRTACFAVGNMVNEGSELGLDWGSYRCWGPYG
jgi:hypothetical protein